MDQLISTFHIDLQLLIAQIVNFGLVFAALYFFALKPLSKMLDKRSESIEEGIKNAELSEKIKEDAENDYKEVLSSAKIEADKIILSAYDIAEKEKVEILKNAEKEKVSIIQNAQEVINNNQSQAELEFRTKSAELIVDSIEKMFEGYISKGNGDELIRKITEK